MLDSLPVSDAIAAALLHQEGIMGTILHCVLAYERGDWDNVNCPGLAHEQITRAYLQAVAWTDQADRELLVKTVH